MFFSCHFPWLACLTFCSFCCVAQAFLFACFCRGEPYTYAECVDLCNRRFGTIQDGDKLQYITIGILNESNTKCDCRITIGFIQMLQFNKINPDCYTGLFCINTSLANMWLKKKWLKKTKTELKINFKHQRPKIEVEQVVPGVYTLKPTEEGPTDTQPGGENPPRLGALSYVTGLPSYLWNKLPNKRPSMPTVPMPTMPTIDVSIPSYEELVKKWPSMQAVTDYVPSMNDLRQKLPSMPTMPSAQTIKDYTPTVKSIRDRTPSMQDLRDRVPTMKDFKKRVTFKYPFQRSKDDKPPE